MKQIGLNAKFLSLLSICILGFLTLPAQAGND